jgi:hypothetical protein
MTEYVLSGPARATCKSRNFFAAASPFLTFLSVVVSYHSPTGIQRWGSFFSKLTSSVNLGISLARPSAQKYVCVHDMERQDPHLSPDLIRRFAYGLTLLEPHELRHFQDCDECSSTWWKLKQEAKLEKSDDAKDKSA